MCFAITGPLNAVITGENGLETFTRGRYGHTYISANSSLFNENDETKVATELKRFVTKCYQQEPDKAVYCELPYSQARLMNVLHQVGFAYDDNWYDELAGNERQTVGQRWIIQNNSSVPPRPSFTHTARVTVISKEDERVLLVKKGRAKTFPGGISDAAENPLNTGVRELFEEVGIEVAPEKVIPVGIVHRVPKSDSCGLKAPGDTCFYYAYVVDNANEVPLRLQEEEIVWAGWVHFSDVLQDSSTGNHIKLFVQKMFEGTEKDDTLTHTLPDFHTLYSPERKEAAAKIWNATMAVTVARMSPLFGPKKS